MKRSTRDTSGERGPLRLAYLSIGRHIHTERWLTWFARRGHDVHLLTVQPGPMPGVTVHDITTRVGPKPFRYGISLIKVRRLLRRIAPDLLHVHFLTGYGYWGSFSGFHPRVLTVWGDDVYLTPHQSVLKNALARWALRTADCVTGDSEDILAACADLGASPERLRFAHWGVDFARFHPGGAGDAVRERLGIPPEAPVVLSTRSFTEAYYNIDLVIETGPRVREAFPDVHYVIAGYEGDDARFRRQARDLGFVDDVHWVGRIPHEELPGFLNASTVFLTIPSLDAASISLLEAMASGCAIVTTDLRSACEWVQDRKSGLCIPPRDPDALVDAICTYLGDPSLRERCGREAIRSVRARGEHDANMTCVEAIYESLVEGRGVPAPVDVPG